MDLGHIKRAERPRSIEGRRALVAEVAVGVRNKGVVTALRATVGAARGTHTVCRPTVEPKREAFIAESPVTLGNDSHFQASP